MKTIAILALMIYGTAQAAIIASCASVEHHGHYVEIKDDNKKITVSISDDSDDDEVFSSVSMVTKSGIRLKDPSAMSWAIRQALKGARVVDMSGVVVLKGKLKTSDYLINLNTVSGQHFLQIDDYIEELKCSNDQLGPLASALNEIEVP